MKIVRWLAVAALALPAALTAQLTSFSGTIVDSISRTPLPGVLVTMSGNGFGQTVSSRDDGSFTFRRVTPGTYRIVARRLGFAPMDFSVPVAENGVKLNVALVRIAMLDTVRARTGTGIAGEVGTLRTLRRLGGADLQVVGLTGVRTRADSSGRFFIPLK